MNLNLTEKKIGPHQNTVNFYFFCLLKFFNFDTPIKLYSIQKDILNPWGVPTVRGLGGDSLRVFMYSYPPHL